MAYKRLIAEILKHCGEKERQRAVDRRCGRGSGGGSTVLLGLIVEVQCFPITVIIMYNVRAVLGDIVDLVGVVGTIYEQYTSIRSPTEGSTEEEDDLLKTRSAGPNSSVEDVLGRLGTVRDSDIAPTVRPSDKREISWVEFILGQSYKGCKRFVEEGRL